MEGKRAMQEISRRRFLLGTSMAAVGTHPWFAALAKDLGKRKLLLVGTVTTGRSTSKGIYTYAFDTKTGELEQLALAATSSSPSFLALSPDHKFVYATNEGGFEGGRGGGVSSFAFDQREQTLTPINEVSSVGDGPAYVSVDHTGKCVFAANYAGGSAASFHVDASGKLSDAVSFFQYDPPAGQPRKQSHAHRVTPTPENGYLLVNDLGLDMIHVYKLDATTAKLTPHDPPAWIGAPNSGPRALRWHPNKQLVYCVNELKPTVSVLSWDAGKGVLTTVQEASLVPPGYVGKCAPGDIVFDKKMKYGYVTSRLDNFMATFKVEEDGKLTFMDNTTCGGIRPRDCALDPTDGWLLIADQDSNNIAVIKRDKGSGKLSHSSKSSTIGTPMCLIFPERPNVAL